MWWKCGEMCDGLEFPQMTVSTSLLLPSRALSVLLLSRSLRPIPSMPSPFNPPRSSIRPPSVSPPHPLLPPTATLDRVPQRSRRLRARVVKGGGGSHRQRGEWRHLHASTPTAPKAAGSVAVRTCRRCPCRSLRNSKLRSGGGAAIIRKRGCCGNTLEGRIGCRRATATCRLGEQCEVEDEDEGGDGDGEERR